MLYHYNKKIISKPKKSELFLIAEQNPFQKIVPKKIKAELPKDETPKVNTDLIPEKKISTSVMSNAVKNTALISSAAFSIFGFFGSLFGTMFGAGVGYLGKKGILKIEKERTHIDRKVTFEKPNIKQLAIAGATGSSITTAVLGGIVGSTLGPFGVMIGISIGFLVGAAIGALGGYTGGVILENLYDKDNQKEQVL